MSNLLPTMLDNFFGPAVVRILGVVLKQRAVLELLGDGVAAEDNPTDKRCAVTIRATPQDTADDATVGAGGPDADVDDFDITGVGHVRYTDAAGPWIGGFANATPNRQLAITAIGDDVVLMHETTTSAAANRIISPTGADLTIAAGHTVILFYDGEALRWRVTGVNATPW